MPPGRKKSFHIDSALDAAAAQFSRHGFGGTSLSALESAMGIGRQSLYDTFGDKRALYCRCLQRYRDTTVRRAVAIVRSEADPIEALKQGGACLIPVGPDGFVAPSLLVGALIEFYGQDASVAREVDSSLRLLDSAFRARLRDARKSGRLTSSQEPSLLSRTIVSSLLGMTIASRSSLLRKSPADLLRGLLATFS